MTSSRRNDRAGYELFSTFGGTISSSLFLTRSMIACSLLRSAESASHGFVPSRCPPVVESAVDAVPFSSRTTLPVGEVDQRHSGNRRRARGSPGPRSWDPMLFQRRLAPDEEAHAFEVPPPTKAFWIALGTLFVLDLRDHDRAA